MTIDVYASPDDVAAAIGGGDTEGIEDRLAMALVVASGWVSFRVGGDLAYGELTPPYDVAAVDCPGAWRAATIAVAVRVFKSSDIPFGVLQTGEYGVMVRQRIPEAEIILYGHRHDWGIA